MYFGSYGFMRLGINVPIQGGLSHEIQIQHRIQNISKNQNLYPHQNRIPLLWDIGQQNRKQILIKRYTYHFCMFWAFSTYFSIDKIFYFSTTNDTECLKTRFFQWAVHISDKSINQIAFKKDTALVSSTFSEWNSQFWFTVICRWKVQVKRHFWPKSHRNL